MDRGYKERKKKDFRSEFFLKLNKHSPSIGVCVSLGNENTNRTKINFIFEFIHRPTVYMFIYVLSVYVYIVFGLISVLLLFSYPFSAFSCRRFIQKALQKAIRDLPLLTLYISCVCVCNTAGIVIGCLL